MGYRENVASKRDAEIALRSEENSLVPNVVEFPDDEDALILLISDEHMGSSTYAEDVHMEQLEHAFDRGFYIMHLGDGIEAATRNSIGAGVYTQDEIIDKQMAHWCAVYEPFVKAGRFLGAHPGNHELRVMKDDGVNIMRHMCREIDAKYLGIARVHIFKIGDQSYSMYTTHGASGARLTYTKIKGALDLERVVDVEMYAMGHVHQLSHHVRQFYRVDTKAHTVEKGEKHFMLTGSYLDYANSYAQMKCMEPARLGSPLVDLSCKRHQISITLR